MDVNNYRNTKSEKLMNNVMKQIKLFFLLIVLMSMIVAKAFAYDAKIGGIYYYFSGSNAIVTCENIEIDDDEGEFYSSDYSGSVVIPQSVTYNGVKYSVTSIGNWAFFECSGLTSVTIPSSVTTIGYYAFYGCSDLTSIAIPESVTSIGSSAFYGCSGLTSIIVSNSNTIYDSRNGCNAIIETAYNTLILGCENTIIPESVTSIGDRAFNGCSGLTAITIPEGVTSIGKYAFSDCSGLTSVTIPSSVTTIGYGAFSGCSDLTSIAIPESVTSIGSSTFSRCSGLTSVTIPSSVTSIGDDAFYYCSGLTSITIPESVTSIGTRAFSGCCGLTSITVANSNTIYDSRNDCNAIIKTTSNELIAGCRETIIPNSVTNIGEGAFSGCKNLTSITIPESVTSIGSSAFSDCSGLTSVTIPNCVTSIGAYAFHRCSGLTSVTVGMTTPLTIMSITFSNRSNATLYVPAGCKEAYEAANYWNEFKEIVEIPSEITLTDGEDYNNSNNMELEHLHYSRMYKNTNWQAWYVPFDLTLTSEVMEHFAFAEFAGTYTEEDGSFYITVVRMKEGDVVKANTPYCVQAKAADATNPQVITQADVTLKAAEENSFYVLSARKKITFRGNYSQRTVTADDQNWYVLSGGQYSRQLPGNTIAPYRCFFTIEDRDDNPYSTTPNPSNVKLMVLGENATGISDMNVDNVNSEQYTGTVYDISGRKVSRQHMSKGLYIINGKKVYVK